MEFFCQKMFLSFLFSISLAWVNFGSSRVLGTTPLAIIIAIIVAGGRERPLSAFRTAPDAQIKSERTELKKDAFRTTRTEYLTFLPH